MLSENLGMLSRDLKAIAPFLRSWNHRAVFEQACGVDRILASGVARNLKPNSKGVPQPKRSQPLALFV